MSWWRRPPRPVPTALWAPLLVSYPLLGWRSEAQRERLRERSAEFLARKQFHGANGFVITDEVALTIAAQACLLVLNRSIEAFDGFVGVVVHANEVVASRQIQDEAGVVHAYEECLAGESVDGGPVMLSWHDVAHASRPGGAAYNVVVHEFAHVLDQGPGVLPADLAADWRAVHAAGLAHLRADLDAGREPFLDPYGASDEHEFFPVVAEAFFADPLGLQHFEPELYALYARAFRQDPAAWAADAVASHDFAPDFAPD